jgi:uncharacterized protein (DUF362 family)
LNLSANTVWCSRSPVAGYGSGPAVLAGAASELSGGPVETSAQQALRNLLRWSKCDLDRYGTQSWNPLSDLIPPGSRVVVKPNWVSHRHQTGGSVEGLVTHTSVLDAVLAYVAKTRPASVIVGDAPVQSCDFDKLPVEGGIAAMAEKWSRQIPKLSICDFRRTLLAGTAIGNKKKHSERRDDQFVLFDLGEVSELEAISDGSEKFRVTMYDPDALQQTHAKGKHQYLVAREVIEADVVVNLPKLKTHRKAGLTGALKNIVGINGLKDYLPHHRKGGALDGGDCYKGRSRLKRLAEDALDAANRIGQGPAARWRAQIARLAELAGRACGHDSNLDGSWHGNDTVWRMTLDLQRILHYGRSDGRLANTLQRRVISITDAIVAGEGEGPLAPDPVSLGIMTFGLNTAAVDWVHALLMGFDPYRIPLVREAFAPHRHPLTDFRPEDVHVVLDGRMIPPSDLPRTFGRTFRAPAGWRGHCELYGRAEGVRCSA